MTEDKKGYTPGPWEVENCGVGKQANKLFIWPAKGTGHGFHAVATIHEYFGNKWANARLIAAAPELLALIRSYATTYPLDEYHDKATAAIAKATGDK